MACPLTPLMASVIALTAALTAYADPVGKLPTGIDDSAIYIDTFNLAPGPVYNRDIRVDELAPEPTQNDSSDEAQTEVINERYDSGEVKVRREVRQDELGNYVHHGEWRAFDKNGNQIAVGRYSNGLPDGRWTYVHSANASKLYSTMPYKQFTAPFTSAATLREGQLHGTWTITDSEHRTISIIEFVDGQRNGLCKLYFVSGELMQEIQFVAGVIDGTMRQWNADGKLVVDDTYQNGRKLALQVGYDKAGKKKKSEGMYLHPQLTIENHDDWWQAKPATYKSVGKHDRHGDWSEWHPNSQQKVAGHYVHNRRDGEFTWWFPNGQQQVSGSYREGQESGPWVWWHKNGQKATQGYYVDGLASDTWVFWKPNGQLSRKLDASEVTGETLEAELNPSNSEDTSTADERNREGFPIDR